MEKSKISMSDIQPSKRSSRKLLDDRISPLETIMPGVEEEADDGESILDDQYIMEADNLIFICDDVETRSQAAALLGQNHFMSSYNPLNVLANLLKTSTART